MIKQSPHRIEKELAPQAIFWRPIAYFAVGSHAGEDNLDRYQYISYAMDDAVFELRVYDGQPQSTTTLYLPEEIEDKDTILSLVDRMMVSTTLPQTSLAWKRGDEYRYGELDRVDDDQLDEPEASILALKIAARSEDHTASIDYIKNQVPNFYSLSEIDEQRSPPRGPESKWQKIIDNLPSAERPGLFSQGYAHPAMEGIQVTESGIDYLHRIGFWPMSE